MTTIDCNKKLHVCFNYTQSAVDYFGMVTWTSMRRCGQFIYTQLEMDQLIQYVKQISFVKRISRETQVIQPVIDESRITELSATIQALEERLKYLETTHFQKHTAMTHGQDYKRKINQKQKGLLQQILFDNKQLKRSSKKLSSEDT